LGKTVGFHVGIATPPAAVNYQWLFNGNPLSNGGAISGATTADLTVTGVAAANIGNYICLATNQAHTDHVTLSTPASLSADSFNLYPVITINGVIGDTYVCQYTSSLTPPVTWTSFATNTLAGSIQYVIDLSASLSTQRFYRVVQP